MLIIFVMQQLLHVSDVLLNQFIPEWCNFMDGKMQRWQGIIIAIYSQLLKYSYITDIVTLLHNKLTIAILLLHTEHVHTVLPPVIHRERCLKILCLCISECVVLKAFENFLWSVLINFFQLTIAHIRQFILIWILITRLFCHIF